MGFLDLDLHCFEIVGELWCWFCNL